MRLVLAFGAALAATVVAAPPAHAEDDWTPVRSFTVAPGASWGPTTSFGTNCTHILTATTVYDQPMTFYDSTDGLVSYVPVVNGTAVATWTPKNPGAHRLYAYQTSHGGPQHTIEVGTGVAVGPACFVLP